MDGYGKDPQSEQPDPRRWTTLRPSAGALLYCLRHMRGEAERVGMHMTAHLIDCAVLTLADEAALASDSGAGTQT